MLNIVFTLVSYGRGVARKGFPLFFYAEKNGVIMKMRTWYNPKYFKLQEFVCKCGCGLGRGSNDLLPVALLLSLDMIRETIEMPVIVTSGWRCPKHNVKSGGVPGSKHLSGYAADIAAQNYQALVDACAKIAPIYNLKTIQYNSRKFVHLEVV